MQQPSSLLKYILKDSFLLIFSRMSLQSANFLFAVLMANYLSSEVFGDYQIIAVLINVICIPATAGVNLFSRLTSEFRAKGTPESVQHYLQKILYLLGVGFCIISILIFICDNTLKSIFHANIDNGFFIGMLSIWAFYSLSIFFGFFQGSEKFNKLSAMFLFMAALRLIGGGIVIWFKLDVTVVLSILFLSFAIPLFYIYLRNRRGFLVPIGTPIPKSTLPKKYFIFSSIVFLFFTMFQNVDLLFIKTHFDRLASGDYAKIFLVGKAVFFAGSCVVMVIFPKISRMYDEGKNTTNYLLKGLWSLLILIALTVIIVSSLSQVLLTLVFKNSNDIILRLFLPIVLANGFHTILYLLVSYEVAVLRIGILLPVVLIFFIQFIFLCSIGQTLENVAWGVVGGGIFGIVVMSYWYYYGHEKFSFLQVANYCREK